MVGSSEAVLSMLANLLNEFAGALSLQSYFIMTVVPLTLVIVMRILRTGPQRIEIVTK